MKYFKTLALLAVVALSGCNSGGSAATTNSSSSSEASTQQYQNKATASTFPSAASEAATLAQNLAGYKITAVYQESGVIYAGTTTGLFISSNMGNSWTVKNTSSGLPSDQVQQITGDSYGVYAVIGGNVMVSLDHGQTWSVLLKHDTPDFDSISINNGKIYLGYDGGLNFDDDNLFPATASKAGIASSADHGKNWDTNTSVHSIGYRVFSLSLEGNNIYAIDTYKNRLLLSKNGGNKWECRDYSGSCSSKVLSSQPGTLNRVVINDNTVYVGSTTGISISTDNSNTFNLVTTANGLPSNNINDLFYDKTNKQLIAATDNGYAISYDNGKSFMAVAHSELNQIPESNVTSTYVDNYLLLFGTKSGMTIFNRSTDFSQAQKPMIHSAYVFYSSIFPTAKKLYIGTTGDGVKFWDQNKNFWHSIAKTGDSTGIIDNYVYQIIVNNGKTYVATRGGLSISEDNIHWTNITKTQGLASSFAQSVAVSNNNIYLASGPSTDNGISYSHDSGATWATLTFPDIYWTPPIDSGSNNPYMEVKSVFAEGQNVYAATNDGIYLSRDNGKTWSTYLNQRTNANMLGRIIYQIFANGKYIYATSDDGLWASSDGGYSWAQRLTGKRTVMVNVKGGLIYVTLRDGGEAISKDNGKTFIISNNLGYTSYSLIYYVQIEQWWGSYLSTTSIPYTLGMDYNYEPYYTLN